MPPITTVVQPAYDIGFRPAEILLERIVGTAPEGESITIRLPATLKVRESSKVMGQRGADDRFSLSAPSSRR
jgi:DNA-binding LacI/PurR family transcriptional regulator